MPLQVFPNTLSKEFVEKLIERKRSKGGGIFRKKAVESLVYLEQLLWPVNYFEITYSCIEGLIKKATKIYKQRNSIASFILLWNCNLL